MWRSAGVTTILTYKPDIFSVLGIYRNNKWGFRPTIYSSRVMLREGKSRVERDGGDQQVVLLHKEGSAVPSRGLGK